MFDLKEELLKVKSAIQAYYEADTIAAQCMNIYSNLSSELSEESCDVMMRLIAMDMGE